ncbi:MAG TPA: hypothetical protein VFC50_01965, partial [Candidatus Dormibacteraeota bacterium]|nr:hypothetical protein [Candidatus Dormibacteraeota bacterium]
KYGTIAKPVVDNAPPPKPAAKQAEKQENTSSSGPISTRVPAVLFYALYSLAANMFGFAQCVILLRDKSQSQSFTEFALLVSIVWMFMDIYLLFGRDKWNIIRFLRINAYLCALSIIIYALVFQIIGIALQVIMLLFLRNVMYRVGEEE